MLAIGTLEPRKNLPHLVAAFGTIAAAHPDLRLVIAGQDGPARPDVDAAIGRLAPDAASRVLLPGPVSDAGRRALLDGAALLAYPSIYEGFGFPVLEAMTVGLPVVAARAGSIPEVAGDAALLVEPTDEAQLADAITRLLTDDATRRELIARGPRPRARVLVGGHRPEPRRAAIAGSRRRDRRRADESRVPRRPAAAAGARAASAATSASCSRGCPTPASSRSRSRPAAARATCPARVPWIDLGRPYGSIRYELWHRTRRPVVRLDVDVVHAPSLAVPPVRGAPLVVTVHDIAFLRLPARTRRAAA